MDSKEDTNADDDETFKKRNSLLKQHKEEIMLGMHEYVDIKLFTSNFLKKME